jgi:uncharacterized membrane protein YjfL (UPF0719 family)
MYSSRERAEIAPAGSLMGRSTLLLSALNLVCSCRVMFFAWGGIAAVSRRTNTVIFECAIRKQNLT